MKKMERAWSECVRRARQCECPACLTLLRFTSTTKASGGTRRKAGMPPAVRRKALKACQDTCPNQTAHAYGRRP